MKRWWWNVRFAYWIWVACRYNCSWGFAWRCATASDDSYNDGETPADAVDIELSHWEW